MTFSFPTQRPLTTYTPVSGRARRGPRKSPLRLSAPVLATDVIVMMVVFGPTLLTGHMGLVMNISISYCYPVGPFALPYRASWPEVESYTTHPDVLERARVSHARRSAALVCSVWFCR